MGCRRYRTRLSRGRRSGLLSRRSRARPRWQGAVAGGLLGMSTPRHFRLWFLPRYQERTIGDICRLRGFIPMTVLAAEFCMHGAFVGHLGRGPRSSCGLCVRRRQRHCWEWRNIGFTTASSAGRDKLVVLKEPVFVYRRLLRNKNREYLAVGGEMTRRWLGAQT